MTAILMYHQVTEIPRNLDPLGLAIPPDQFDQQMSYLARNGFSCLNLHEAVQHFRNSQPTPRKSFVLTFDDGYQDFYTNACPILDKYGFTATVFLVAGQMGSRSNWWGQEGAHSGFLLSQAEAKDLVRRGYILGSHTLSHPFLNLLDDQSAFEEIRNSRVLLQDTLDTRVDYFAYPFSETNPRIEALVEATGYTAACAGDSGSWSVFHLWRVPCLRGDTTITFSLKVRGWYDKRTALRESVAGLFLRRSVRTIRRRLGIRHPTRQGVMSYAVSQEPERER
jgi:peptidoglycan/xylan/chitin deacetylase (PgdA/CDA1 family)